MHHVSVDQWSRGASALHRRDPRAKIAALLAFLVVLGTAHRELGWLGAVLGCLLMVGLGVAGLPIRPALVRAGVVLPFTFVFALVSWVSGDPARAGALVLKSYLSALAVLLVVSTTPLPVLLRGMEATGAPRYLLMVAQFVYRYLYVISEEAQHMSKAAAARGATVRGIAGNGARFRAAAGALGVLFARSHARAEEIHRAMLARGFPGYFRPCIPLRFRGTDTMFLALCGAGLIIIRILTERAG